MFIKEEDNHFVITIPGQINLLLWKKIGISFFIIFVIIQSISVNISYIDLISHRYEFYVPPVKSTPLNVVIENFNFVGGVLGIRSVWNMFNSVDRAGWSVVLAGVDRNNIDINLRLPYVGNTQIWQDSLVNYRESKLFLNLYTNEFLRYNYAQYICKSSIDSGKPLNQIIYRITTNQFKDPNMQETPRYSVNYPSSGVKYLCKNRY